jgi:hypothetical protein
VRDVALVPERHVFQADERVSPDDAGEAADALGHHGVALVRHRGGALLALAERLGDLADLGASEVTNLERELLQARGGQRECREQLGVPVARDDLRRDRLRLQAEPLAGEPLELRVGRGVGADGAGELADPHRLHRLRQAPAAAVELERPAGELEAEGRGLRMHAVGPADAEVVLVPFRLLDHGVECAIQAFEQQLAGVAHLQRECRVDDVGGREPVVDPAACGADALRDRVDEGGEVVLRLALELRDALWCRRLGTLADLRDRIGGNCAKLGRRFQCRELHVEPPHELAPFRPDLSHRRSGVARDHRLQSRARGGRRPWTKSHTSATPTSHTRATLSGTLEEPRVGGG